MNKQEFTADDAATIAEEAVEHIDARTSETDFSKRLREMRERINQNTG